MKRSPVVFACVLAAALTAAAMQQPASAPQTPPSLVTEVQNSYNNLKGNIIKAMAQFPEDKLTWQPTPEVRSWARLLAHIADGNNGSCSALAGVERPPPPGFGRYAELQGQQHDQGRAGKGGE